MKITVITVGKIKEKYLKDAIAEYTKRLGKYCRLEIIEVADEKTPDAASPAVEEGIREKEGMRILKDIQGRYVTLSPLEIKGNAFDLRGAGRKNRNPRRTGEEQYRLCNRWLYRAGRGSAAPLGLCLKLL